MIVFTLEDIDKLIETKRHSFENVCRICDHGISKSNISNVAHLNDHTPAEIYEFIECPSCGGEKFCDYIIRGDESERKACDVCNPHGDEEDPDRAYDAMKDAQAEEYFEKLEKEPMK